MHGDAHMLRALRERRVNARASDLYAVFSALGGRLYWYLLLPVHARIFDRRANRIGELAEVSAHRSRRAPCERGSEPLDA